MYCWYLRNTYLENNLVKPGKLTVCGEKVDLGRIDAPAYVYASREDHIVPWEGAYRNTQVLEGQDPLRAGRVGPHRRRDQPAGQEEAQPLDRRHGRACRRSAQAWFDKAKEHPGSWWTDWSSWLKTPRRQTGRRAQGARQQAHKAIEPAPGRYVKQKA